jgi:HK97 family phage prohead protease
MADKNKIEKRSNLISSTDNNRVTGYAMVFNSLSDDLGGFYEKIDRNALTQATIDACDVFAVLNHDRNRGIFARSKNGKGSLILTLDPVGLKYEFELADTPIAQELRAYLERGEIDSSSFAFTVEKDVWEKRNDTLYDRTILQIGMLFDICPVFQPAYRETSVALRALVEKRSADEEEQKIKEREKRSKELNVYYMNLGNQISNHYCPVKQNTNHFTSVNYR